MTTVLVALKCKRSPIVKADRYWGMENDENGYVTATYVNEFTNDDENVSPVISMLHLLIAECLLRSMNVTSQENYSVTSQ